MNNDDLKRAVVWKNLLLDGTDHCALFRTTEGWLLKGTVVGVLKDQRPILANYEIYCDENWLTHRVHVERRIGSDVKDLSLSVESRGVWRSSGQELRDVRGCDDVDLAVTPATNTLPIRRLNLQIGSSESSHCRLGEISRAYGSTTVPTVYAASRGHLPLRKQDRVLGSDHSG